MRLEHRIEVVQVKMSSSCAVANIVIRTPGVARASSSSDPVESRQIAKLLKAVLPTLRYNVGQSLQQKHVPAIRWQMEGDRRG